MSLQAYNGGVCDRRLLNDMLWVFCGAAVVSLYATGQL